MFIGQICFDEKRDRLVLDGVDLHCGDSLQVLVLDAENKAKWIDVYVEYGNNGYCICNNDGGIPHLLPYIPSGLFGRMLSSCESSYPES